MAATKKILKLTHNDANVKITSASADTATISVGTDLKLGSESVATGVVSTTVGAGGSGYTAPPQVVFTTSPGFSGWGAQAVAILAADAVSTVQMTNYGTGYTAAPAVSFVPVGTGGTGASGTAVLGTGARVTIEKVLWSVQTGSGSLTVTRNSEAVLTLFGSGEMDLNAKGMVEDQNNSHDIAVAFAGSGGTCFLKLRKVDGYEG